MSNNNDVVDIPMLDNLCSEQGVEIEDVVLTQEHFMDGIENIKDADTENVEDEMCVPLGFGLDDYLFNPAHDWHDANVWAEDYSNFY